MLGVSAASVEADRPRSAREIAEQTGAIVVLKGRYTIIAYPDGGLIVNQAGSPALAKAGSGDILTGMIGALLARGIPAEKAAPMGVYLHAKAGEAAGQAHSATHREILSAIGPAYTRLLSAFVPH